MIASSRGVGFIYSTRAQHPTVCHAYHSLIHIALHALISKTVLEKILHLCLNISNKFERERVHDIPQDSSPWPTLATLRFSRTARLPPKPVYNALPKAGWFSAPSF